ncbi:hypothetical protein ABGF49_01995 [Helcococcus ovis]|uniref:Uncharacterized protein n=4 Tax=Helcococcus ovis TaxID=72026 RepID=A0A4R9BZT5_9FIRM|nr:hypothetical protein [Helcococcus ovis]TFF63891.1 hypothetical protein EQF92_08000 [Helcococcus ovis]TFF64590.1 hypothetical protein EQF91_07490 [Helcococcus ovis]
MKNLKKYIYFLLQLYISNIYVGYLFNVKGNKSLLLEFNSIKDNNVFGIYILFIYILIFFIISEKIFYLISKDRYFEMIRYGHLYLYIKKSIIKIFYECLFFSFLKLLISLFLAYMHDKIYSINYYQILLDLLLFTFMLFLFALFILILSFFVVKFIATISATLLFVVNIFLYNLIFSYYLLICISLVIIELFLIFYIITKRDIFRIRRENE